MVRVALIVGIWLLLAAGGCDGNRPAVVSEKPVPTYIEVRTPCIDAADRRPRPSALADEAMPTDPKPLVAVLLAKLKEFYPWSKLAERQLDACMRK